MAYFLNAGNLISGTTCTIGDYKIEWRLDSREGSVVLISGNTGNTDPDIDARHPLVNEIVIGGTLYPVIIYAYLDGDKYTSEYELGSYYSPDLYDCLDPIIVDTIDCSTSLNPTSEYQFSLTRLSNVGEKNRSIKFDLGATTNYMAWEFTAVNIPDKLNVYYCTASDFTGTLIDSMMLGTGIASNLSPSNYPTNPIVMNTSSAIKYVSDLTPFTYQAGDWIKFEVLGNVLNPSQNDTQWTLKAQCLEALDLTNNFADCGKIDLTSLQVTNNTSLCRREVRYKTLDSLYSANNGPNIFLRKYFTFSTSIDINLSPNSAGVTTSATQSHPQYFVHNFPYNTSAYISYISTGSSSTICTTLAGSMNIFKNSGNLVFTFSNAADYTLMRDNIEYIKNSAQYADFESAAPTDVEYYGFYVFNLKIGNNCDTVTSEPAYYVHWGSTVTYNPNTSITLTLNPLTNSLPDPVGSCDTVKSTVTNYVNYHNATYNNNTINLVTYTRNSGVSGNLPIGHAISTQSLNATQRTAYRRFWTYPILMNGLVDLTNYGFCVDGSMLSLFLYYDRVNITDVNAYTLERRESLDTNDCSQTGWIIKAQEP